MLVSRKPQEIFGQTEFDVRDIVHKFDAKAFQEYLREKNGHQGSRIDCPGCRQSAEFHNYRPIPPLSLFGSLPISHDNYYCHKCGGMTP